MAKYERFDHGLRRLEYTFGPQLGFQREYDECFELSISKALDAPISQGSPEPRMNSGRLHVLY